MTDGDGGRSQTCLKQSLRIGRSLFSLRWERAPRARAILLPRPLGQNPGSQLRVMRGSPL